MPVDPRALVVHLDEPYASYKPVLAPARDVVLAGLAWPTEHWAVLAVSWLEQGAPIDQEIALGLGQVAQKKHFGQSIRHRAFALARRWQRQQSQNGA
jgi:hypothetical protein